MNFDRFISSLSHLAQRILVAGLVYQAAEQPVLFVEQCFGAVELDLGRP
jgi:hypothetical protein